MTVAPADVPCIVLAGGLGTRLRDTVGDVPKCLAPVGAQTFLDIQLATLWAAGVGRVVLSLGHQAGQVVALVRTRHAQRPVQWVIEPKPLGTGGAIAHVMDTMGIDEALVANGDTHLDGDLSAMLSPLERARGEIFRMALVKVQDRSRFGGVETDALGRVVGFLEKGRSDAGAINAGMYRLARAALPAAGAGAYSLEADVLPDLVLRGAAWAREVDGRFIDIGVPEDYFRFCAGHGA